MSVAIFNMAGGGATGLSVTAYANVGSLPSSAAAGDIAIITSVALGNVYAGIAATGSPVNNDIWVWLGGATRAPIALTDKISLAPRAVYQRVSGAWVLKPSYVYTGSAWVEITLYVYDYGVNIMSAFTPIGEGYDVTRVTYAAGSGSITVSITGSSVTAYRYCYADTAIDLTNISKVKITYQYALSSGGAIDARFQRLVVATARTIAGVAAYVVLSTNGTYTTELDVSALSGLFYIGFTFWTATGNVSASGQIYRVALEQ